MLGFDGHLNTGLTLRTVRIANGVAEVRAGATLLFDSEPEAEERETELKASAMRDAVLCADSEVGSKGRSKGSPWAAPRTELGSHRAPCKDEGTQIRQPRCFVVPVRTFLQLPQNGSEPSRK